MKTKTLTVDVKAIDSGDEEGTFEAYAAVFGNVDSYGDKIVPGAFAESLAEYGPDGSGIPLYWCHRLDDPFMNLGQTLTASEDDHGLLVKPQLDLETAAGKQTHKLLKSGRVKQMSFAYDVLEGAWVNSEEEGSFYELRKLRLHEISIVPIGANQETEILAVKSAADAVEAGVKAGGPLSADQWAELKRAIDVLNGVLTNQSSDEKSSGAPQAKTDESAAASKSRVLVAETHLASLV